MYRLVSLIFFRFNGIYSFFDDLESLESLDLLLFFDRLLLLLLDLESTSLRVLLFLCLIVLPFLKASG